MKLERMDGMLLRGLYLAAAGLVLLQLLGQEGLVSLLFSLTFPLTGLLWLRTVRRTLTGNDLLMLLAVTLAAAAVLLDAGLTGTALHFGYVKKLIMFAMTLLLFQAASRFRVDEGMARFLHGIGDGLSVLLMGAYFLGGSRMYEIHGRMSAYLTFGFSNPNLAAMLLACLYMMQLVRLFAPGKRWLHCAMAAMLGWLVVQTGSRNCLLAVLLFSAALWLSRKRGRGNPMSRASASVAAALPGLFVPVYGTWVSSDWAEKTFAFLTGEGKGLDSRMSVWGPAMEVLARSPLIGGYSAISGGTGISQMHNTHLDIAVSYGLPVLILVCVLLGRYLHFGGRRLSREKGACLLAFGGGLMLGIGEAAVFSGGLGIHLFVGMFLLLAGREDGETI